jgi:UDP-N-acetylmuramyl pentapeptide synthase
LRQAELTWKGEMFTVSFPFVSDIECGNAMTALVTALQLGVPVEQAIAGVGTLSALDMRMEQVEGIDDSILINDAYSFDVSSLKLAMQDVWRMQKDHPHVLILSDLPQSEALQYGLIQQEFQAYSYKTDRLTGDVLCDIVDAENHAIDALRYAITPLIKRKKQGMAW